MCIFASSIPLTILFMIESSKDKYIDIAVQELQMPTRLRGPYKDYEFTPDLSGVIIEDDPKTTFDNIKKMFLRADNRWEKNDYVRYNTARETYQNLPSEEKAKVDEFREKRNKTFKNFIAKYEPFKEAFQAYNLLGIDQSDKKGDLFWGIVAEHSVVAAKIADISSRAMPEELVNEKIKRENINLTSQNQTEITEQAVNEVVIGTMLQDLSKREEIEFNNLKDIKGKISLIRGLVKEGVGKAEDITLVENEPKKADVTYERLLQSKKEDYIRRFSEKFKQYGNPETIINCARSAGMPVVEREKDENGHYLPTLAQRIANFADKLVQHTGIVSSLKQRHESVAMRYFPRELVDKEYDYAHLCAEEFAKLMKGVSSGDQIPQYVLESIMQEILATDITK